MVRSDMVRAQPADWQRAGEAVTRRRQELGISREQAVGLAKGRPALSTWETLENARATGPKAITQMRRASLEGISAALGWTRDSFELILAGEEPVVVQGESGDPRWTAATDEERNAVAAFLEGFRAGRRQPR
jgi:hypothetical protein